MCVYVCVCDSFTYSKAFIRRTFCQSAHTATHCNTLQHSQHATKHYHTLPHTAKHCKTLPHVAPRCTTLNTLQHAATCCNTHSRTARSSSDSKPFSKSTSHPRTHNATHCNTLQHAATHCNMHSRTFDLSSADRPSIKYTLHSVRIAVSHPLMPRTPDFATTPRKMKKAPRARNTNVNSPPKKLQTRLIQTCDRTRQEHTFMCVTGFIRNIRVNQTGKLLCVCVRVYAWGARQAAPGAAARHSQSARVQGRAAAEGFSPTSPRAHWIGPEQG